MTISKTHGKPEKMTPFGDLYPLTLSAYARCLERGALLDSEGSARAATEDGYCPGCQYMSGDSLPDWATHVVWVAK